MGKEEEHKNNHSQSINNLPNGWVELIDPTSGKTYYFNEEMNESSWDMPLVDQQDESLVISSDLQKEGGGNVVPTNDTVMNSDVDVIDNGEVSHKEEDKDDSITLPSDNVKVNDVGLIDDIVNDNTIFEDAKMNESEVDERINNHSEPINNAQNGCVELIDPTSGKTYYFNEETDASSWDMPLVDQQDESLAISSSDLQKEEGGDVSLPNVALMNSEVDVIDNGEVFLEELEKSDSIALPSDNVEVNDVGLIDDIVNDDIFENAKMNENEEDEHKSDYLEHIDNNNAILENFNETETT